MLRARIAVVGGTSVDPEIGHSLMCSSR